MAATSEFNVVTYRKSSGDESGLDVVGAIPISMIESLPRRREKGKLIRTLATAKGNSLNQLAQQDELIKVSRPGLYQVRRLGWNAFVQQFLDLMLGPCKPGTLSSDKLHCLTTRAQY